MLQSRRGPGQAQRHKGFTERAPPSAVSPEAAPHHVSSATTFTERSLKAWLRRGGLGLDPFIQRRRCSQGDVPHGPLTTGTAHRPARPLTGLETCARSPQWVREPRANPSLPLRQRAQPRGCFAAGPHAEGAARLPITGPSSGDSATAERETPEGHHGSAGSRTEHSSLPRLEKWCSSFFSEPRLKSSIHFPIL